MSNEQKCTGCGATVTEFHDKQDDSYEWRDVTGSPYCPMGDVHYVEPQSEKCSFSIGDTVRWMGQDGPKVGTVRRITHPENAGFVLWVGDGEMEDFPLVESQVTVSLPPVAIKQEASVLDYHRKIVALAEGWDADGATGPKSPLSWESVARMAMDFSQAAIATAEGRYEEHVAAIRESAVQA
jgi:hypothetical protein